MAAPAPTEITYDGDSIQKIQVFRPMSPLSVNIRLIEQSVDEFMASHGLGRLTVNNISVPHLMMSDRDIPFHIMAAGYHLWIFEVSVIPFLVARDAVSFAVQTKYHKGARDFFAAFIGDKFALAVQEDHPYPPELDRQLRRPFRNSPHEVSFHEQYLKGLPTIEHVQQLRRLGDLDAVVKLGVALLTSAISHMHGLLDVLVNQFNSQNVTIEHTNMYHARAKVSSDKVWPLIEATFLKKKKHG